MEVSKNRPMIGILLIVFLFFITLIAFTAYTFKAYQGEEDGEVISNSDKIGVIEVEGIILDSKKTVEKLFKAEKDKEIKAIIVRVDSPGGAVGPVQEIYEEIRRIDEIKPVYASFGSVAASGGYYIGAATRRIYSSPGTLTGSIGVIMQFFDLSKLYEFAKINHSSIKAGRFKDMGQPYRDLTPEEKDYMKGMLGGVHQQFLNDIIKTRPKVKEKMGELGQGQIFSGEMARDYGLVDELTGLWGAGRAIHAELKLKGEFNFKYVKDKKKFSWGDLLENMEEVISPLDFRSLSQSVPMLMYKM